MKFTEEVVEYIKLLNDETLLDSKEKDFWQYEMGLDFEEINTVIGDKNEIINILGKSKVKSYFLEIIFGLVFGIKELKKGTSYKKDKLKKIVAEEIEGKKRYINIISIIYFLDGMTESGINYVAPSIINTEEMNVCKYYYHGKKHEDILALGIMIFSKKPSNLYIVEASQVIVGRKFNDYTLAKNYSDDNLEVNKEAINDVIYNGIDNENIDDDLIQSVLREVERSKGTRFNSRYINSIAVENDLYVILFREFQKTRFRTIDEGCYVINEAEIVILRFSTKAKFCSIISHENNENIAVEIANGIIVKIASPYLKYIAADDMTDEKTLKEFINYLLNQESKEIQLYEIYFEHCPLDLSPKLILRSNDYQTGLKLPLEQLKRNHSLDLLGENLNLINKIKVSYKLPGKKNDKYKIIKLNFEERENNKYVIKHSMYKMSIEKQEKFKKLLDDRFGMKIYG
ncbi:MAG: hypothetical protein ACOCRO_05350 [Halanaerobiales bacterium]